MLRNIRLLLEYDGTRYHGWQRQPDAPSIQAVLEDAVARLTGEKVALIGSGRTDAGVHARGQVANFRTDSAIPLKAFHQGLNSLLPKDIAVLEATEAPPEFHARKSAWAKTYEYRILNRPNRSPLNHHYAWWLAPRLDLAAMDGAAAALPGEHDFTAFRASGSDNINPVRRVLAAEWRDGPGGWLTFTITATGFLRGMVRSLVGTLVEVGRGKAPPLILAELLESHARYLAGPTAPPQGLYLVEVFYENEPVGRDSAPASSRSRFNDGGQGHRPTKPLTDLKSFWWHRYLTGAGAQVENLCHQRRRVREARPTRFFIMYG